ncbi:hypothetical protein SELMODRAFT_411406 [Selaginella moellendorffii]|uniref:Uncharacterized protein n=1 Tax=Selaginella moellendorffii TaxID=88036 RepID=D8RHT9_SELML|nr:hypothetical protein SELMODRAFT_432099 [Selaginella moellendorffii]EFJ28127.1 hypothetical protein SELMODRAFT_411406 [Selaginella moellendorffii]
MPIINLKCFTNVCKMILYSGHRNNGMAGGKDDWCGADAKSQAHNNQPWKQLVFGQLRIPLVPGLLHVSPLQEIPWTQSEAYDSSMGDITKSLKLWMTCISLTQMLRGKDPSEPKLSMRKELKRRWQEYRATPFVLDKQRDADKSLVSSHKEFQAHLQLLGEKMFEARVSDIFNYRYILEASIDGKLFCGLLFSYKPGFAQAVQSYMARFVSFDSQLLSMKHCNLQKISPMVFRRALLDLEFNKIWSISIHVHTLWDGKSNLQTCQASNLHCRPLLRYYRMKLKDKKILKGRLAKYIVEAVSIQCIRSLLETMIYRVSKKPSLHCRVHTPLSKELIPQINPCTTTQCSYKARSWSTVHDFRVGSNMLKTGRLLITIEQQGKNIQEAFQDPTLYFVGNSALGSPNLQHAGTALQSVGISPIQDVCKYAQILKILKEI